jgi:hypothetical protein
MDSTGTGTAEWEARPLGERPTLLGGVRWGVAHVPTGRWVAFGGEARCRLMAEHLNEADAILRGPASAGTRSGSADA